MKKAFCLLAAIGFLVLAKGCVAAPNPDLTIAFAAQTGPNLCVGQPIVVHTDIVNTSSECALIHVGLHQEWCSLHLADAAGNSVPQRPDLEPTLIGGFRDDGIETLQPHDCVDASRTEYAGDIVVTQHFLITQPGDYILTLSAQLSYALFSPKAEFGNEALLKTSGKTAASERTLRFTVAPADPARLSALAQQLCLKIETDTSNARLAKAWTYALFSIPEEDAYPSWRELATHHRGDLEANRTYAVIGLRMVHTRKAIDLLAYLRWNTDVTRYQSPGNSPSEALDQLYQMGDPSVRAQVAAISAAHGVTDFSYLEIPSGMNN